MCETSFKAFCAPLLLAKRVEPSQNWNERTNPSTPFGFQPKGAALAPKENAFFARSTQAKGALATTSPFRDE